jgi:DNA polymerase-3 subunit alpha
MPDEKDFVHLHVHTEFSLLDGLSQIKRLVKRSADAGMDALAITDHGSMFGVIDFYRAAKAAGIKPIIGMEAYMARRGMHDRESDLDSRPYHLLLLAKNQTGYKNLLKIASASQLEGYYYRPRIDHEFLAQHADGLIATSGCLAAEIPRMVEQGREDEALRLIGWHRDVFGPDNFFLELQHHNIDELHALNRWLLQHQDYAQVPLVATNDVHYVLDDDYDAHDTLLCIQTGNVKAEQNRLRFASRTFHLRTPEEMWNLFADVPEALYNTRLIADMCDVSLESEGYHLPVFPVPEGFTAETYLRHLCEAGLKWRYAARADDPDIVTRLNYELGIIHNMGFDTYFLIVWDLCEFARHADIWWNVRGSGAGSVAAYCLGITNIDPLRNGLLFERFLNPGRVSMPDIDLDYPEDRRAEMIQYCAQKYGEDKVAAIITFGTMGAKAAIRDVGRAFDMPLPEVDRIARLIPTLPGKPLKFDDLLGDDPEKALPELKEVYNNDEHAHKLIDTARQLEGITRHASTHAAGVIVADKPLVEYIPLHRPTKGSAEDAPVKQVTQFPMETCESIGLLKVDFLGLSTLTIMRRACELIEQYHGIHYDLSNIPYRPDPDDPDQARMVAEMFEMIGRGETVGVFQLESQGMRRMLTDMRPSKFEHIVAGISLYRPGPLEYIPTYNRRLHGEEKVEYKHELLRSILEETYGIIVYQEQLMQIGAELFGYELGEADLMRRAVSKKKKEALQKHREIFIERGPEHGVDPASANAIFDDIEFFARYGFNKCLTHDTEIIDAETGRLVRIGDLADGSATIEHTITCDLDTMRLQPGHVTDVISNGVKPVYRLTTQLGRTITATANHPLYTFDGWRMLGELKPGDQIATPRQIPVEGRNVWEDYQVIVLGHLIAEGNLCHPHGAYYYTTDDEQLADYVANLEQFDNTTASTSYHKSAYSVYSRRTNLKQSCGVVEWLKSLGIWGKNSHTKTIPDEVFELTNRQIGLLIARMWEGDGHINEKGRSLYYATASIQLARQLQHLFLRLGIVTRLREVIFPYKDGRVGYQLFVTGYENMRIFSEAVGCHFVSAKRKEILEKLLACGDNARSSKDVIPLEIKHIIRQQKEKSGFIWDEIHEQIGVAQREFSPTSTAAKSGFRRETIGRLATFFNSDELRAYADGDIYWDKIVSIDYAGEEEVFDLTVPGMHNFIANDILVHNSHAADYAVLTCQTAFLKCHYPHEYMAALMSVHRDDAGKVGLFAADCARMGIDILPPTVNNSELDFSIEQHGDGRAIRFGMGAIKNLGVGPVEHILDQRGAGGRFRDLEDFCQRVDTRTVNKRALESLIKVGALDEFAPRPTLLAALDRIVSFSADYHKAKDIGQMSLFGETTGVDFGTVDNILGAVRDVDPVSRREMLNWEKELVGLYVTDHPLRPLAEQFARANLTPAAELNEAGEALNGQPVSIAGLVTNIRSFATKKGDMMAILTVEDITGTITAVLFPRTWGEYRDLIDQDAVIVVKGKADTSRGDIQVIVDSVQQNFEFATAVSTPPVMEQKFSWMADDDGDDGELLRGDDEPGEPLPRDETPDEPVSPAPPPAPAPRSAIIDDREMPPWLEDELDNGWTPPPPIEYHDDQGYMVRKSEPNGYQDDRTIKPPPAAAARPRTEADPEPPREIARPRRKPAPPEPAPAPPPGRLLTLYIQRTGDSEKDQRRLKFIHGRVSEFPGVDHFRFVLEGGDKPPVTMNFPKHPIEINDEVLAFVTEKLGEDNVLITEE